MIHLLETLWQDLRYGARLLRTRPGFTAIIVIILALGIGATTAVFSVVNSVLLRPLNYPAADRIVTVWEDHTRRQGPAREWTSPTGVQDWREQGSQVFSHIAAVNSWPATLTEAGEPEVLAGASVSSEAFAVLGVQPFLGRAFTEEEDQTNAAKVIVLGHSLWQRRFNGDPAIVGKAVRLNGESYTVVGVLPEGLQLPIITNAEIWRPIRPTFNPGCQRGCYTLRVIARLQDGVTLERARTEMSAVGARIAQQFPESNKDVGVTIVPLQEFFVGDLRPALFVLLAAIALVLLITCANVANLLLSKAVAREREMAIRAALGAGRRQIVRQLLSESLLLALLGGGLGVLSAYWLVELFQAIAPTGTPRIDEVRIDGRVLLFSLGVSLLTGLLCGLVPALQAARGDLNQMLRESGAGNKMSSGGGRVRSVLVVAEIAIALVLLIGAGLLMRSFVRLQSVDPGFRPTSALTVRVGLPLTAYPKREQVGIFYQQLQEKLQAIPGVQAVAFSSTLPMAGIDTDTGFQIEGRPAPPPGQTSAAWFSVVSHEYFNTMGINLRAGRAFDTRESEQSPCAVVVTEAMARRFFPGENPLGQRLIFGSQQTIRCEIIGTVADVHHFGLSTDARPTFYFSARQRSRNAMSVVLRTSGNPMTYVNAVRDAVRSLDPDLAITNVQTLEQLVATSVATPRFVLSLFGSFAAIALVLASLGIYGVIAYTVTQRTRELGIRLALGARGADVVRLVMGQGMRLALLGLALGLLASFGLMRLMTKLLFGVTATDPFTFAGIALLLGAVALLACWIPAQRATKVDPMIALRHE